MNPELDEILLEQLHVARHMAKKMRKAGKIMGDDPTLLALQEMNKKKIQYFEYMIQDKSLLHKKRRKRRKRDKDVLARGMFQEWYRNAYVVTKIGYNLMVNSVQAYMSLFTIRKGKE